MLPMSLCPCRVTDATYAQTFADNRHKFYLEFRCNRPCFKDMGACIRCLQKTSKLQTSRTFDHGTVQDPIPTASHLYGGTWYEEGVKKWGAPPSEIQEVALRCQMEARTGVAANAFMGIEAIRNAIESKHKDAVTTESKEMPKKASKKPPIIKDVPTTVAATVDTAVPVVESPMEPVIPKKTRRRPPITAYSAVLEAPPVIHKEVVLPTHMEQTMEEIDTEGYAIEYVKLKPFAVGGTTYFRDFNKNKLYRRIKESVIGEYVGRYDPDREAIHTEVPDSDAE
jgi:hypothetical protein